MYKYLVADYIVGFCLSSEDYFSAGEIAKELFAPEEEVLKIMMELQVLKAHWFEVDGDLSEIHQPVKRCKKFDSEIVAWLKNGESARLFKETKIMDESGLTTRKKKPPTAFQRGLGKIFKTLFPKK